MQVFHGLENSALKKIPIVLSIGNFDGVHRGHQELIKQVVAESKKFSAQSVILTFSPHPVEVLYPEKVLTKLFSESDLKTQIENIGVDILVFIPFTKSLSKLKGGEFLDWIQTQSFALKKLIVGYDFAMGSDRESTHQVLKQYCANKEIQFEVIGALKIEGEIVSSTRVRELLTQGNVLKVKKYLGRAYKYQGVVIKGDQRGRTIGFPTANLQPDCVFVPKKGVYQSRFKVNQQWYPSITNIGLNPTVSQTLSVKIETHIINFDQEIYGEFCEVELVDFIREEKKFSSLQELTHQIKLDLKTVMDQIK